MYFICCFLYFRNACVGNTKEFFRLELESCAGEKEGLEVLETRKDFGVRGQTH